MTNNFKQISKLMSFNNDDEFYFAQIIQRKKDNAGIVGSNNSNRLIKAYYIKSVEQLLELEDEMIFFANYFNARVGLNLNKRSYRKTAFHTLKKVTDQILNEDYKSTRRAYNTMCGKYATGDSFWILDYDGEEMNNANNIKSVCDSLKECQPFGDKIIDIIPTKNGWHFITKPFNIKEAENLLHKYDLDVHKNNPTVLYIK